MRLRTSSIVTRSLSMEAAIVSMPTSPPWKRSMIALKISLSGRSSPKPDSPNAARPSRSIINVNAAVAPACEKSRMRWPIRLLHAVYRERFAISVSDASSISTCRIDAVLRIICFNSSVVYNSDLLITEAVPQRRRISCRSGGRADQVNFARSRRIDLAEGRLPMMISSA